VLLENDTYPATSSELLKCQCNADRLFCASCPESDRLSLKVTIQSEIGLCDVVINIIRPFH
jgi:hypothetical protein